MSDLHFPWNDEDLVELLGSIIARGETTKVDFKRELELSSSSQSELLKDILAFANTFDYAYNNYGFILIGVEANTLCYTTFKQNADSLQATIDEIVKNYIEPFVPTHVKIFGTGDACWGVIVIPPTKNAPHVIVKDNHKRYRGDIYVRRGTITDKASPADFNRFFRQHLEEEMFVVQQQIRDLRKEVTTLKDLVGKQKRPEISVSTHNQITSEYQKPESDLLKVDVLENTSLDLLGKMKVALEEQLDPVYTNLVAESKRISAFLRSDKLRWDIYPNDTIACIESLNAIEAECLQFWKSLSYVIKNDNKHIYNKAIIDSITALSKSHEAPAGQNYTDLGTNIRYYPLVVSLYIVFIYGSATYNDKLLKHIKSLALSRKSFYSNDYSILDSLFFIRRSSEVFQMKKPGYPNTKWCDAVGTVIKDLIIDIIETDEDIADATNLFFIGEFILCLSPTQQRRNEYPSSGAFFYYNDSEPIIKRLLIKEKEWLQKLFDGDLRTLLERFDKHAPSMANQRGCWGNGFQSEAVATAFPIEEML